MLQRESIFQSISMAEEGKRLPQIIHVMFKQIRYLLPINFNLQLAPGRVFEQHLAD